MSSGYGFLNLNLWIFRRVHVGSSSTPIPRRARAESINKLERVPNRVPVFARFEKRSVSREEAGFYLGAGRTPANVQIVSFTRIRNEFPFSREWHLLQCEEAGVRQSEQTSGHSITSHIGVVCENGTDCFVSPCSAFLTNPGDSTVRNDVVAKIKVIAVGVYRPNATHAGSVNQAVAHSVPVAGAALRSPEDYSISDVVKEVVF